MPCFTLCLPSPSSKYTVLCRWSRWFDAEKRETVCHNLPIERKNYYRCSIAWCATATDIFNGNAIWFMMCISALKKNMTFITIDLITSNQKSPSTLIGQWKRKWKRKRKLDERTNTLFSFEVRQQCFHSSFFFCFIGGCRSVYLTKEICSNKSIDIFPFPCPTMDHKYKWNKYFVTFCCCCCWSHRCQFLSLHLKCGVLMQRMKARTSKKKNTFTS